MGYAAPTDTERVIGLVAGQGQKEVNGVGRARCRRNGLSEGIREESRLKITRMRRNAAVRANHVREPDLGPAGKIACFKSRISNEICLGGTGN